MPVFFNDKDMRLEILEEGKSSRKIKACGNALMCVEVFYEKGGVGQPHTHMHEQATYCLSGEFEFTVGGETSVITQGDSVYIPPKVLHGCRLISDTGRLLDVFTPIREDFLTKESV